MPSLLAIGAFTLLPLLGVLLFGWDWREVLVLYWLENVSLGIVMFLHLLRTAGDQGDTALVMNRHAGGPLAGVFLAAFFAIHYGLFTIGHGVFVFAMIDEAFIPRPTITDPEAVILRGLSSSIDWVGILLVWLVGGTIQVLVAIFGPLPPQRGRALMMSAYPRIIVLHLVIIGGVFLIAAWGLPAIAAILLIVVHGVADAGGWLTTSRIKRHVEQQQGFDLFDRRHKYLP